MVKLNPYVRAVSKLAYQYIKDFFDDDFGGSAKITEYAISNHVEISVVCDPELYEPLVMKIHFAIIGMCLAWTELLHMDSSHQPYTELYHSERDPWKYIFSIGAHE